MKKKTKDIIKIKKIPLILLVVFLVIAIVGIARAQISATSFGSDLSPTYQYYQPSFQSYYTSEQIANYWPILGKEECMARQDLILTIRPGGCQPAVVRSDLLEEQNVPVFCQIDAIKINPLIDINSIESMSFRGSYPKDVSGVGFHPARAAVRSYNTLLGSPLINNVGYLVVTLKRQNSEKEMPEFVEGNLTARIRYNIQDAFGVGRAEFVLPVISDREWENNYEDYSFWRGKGFLRANEIDENGATISVYRDATHKESSAVIQKGKTSEIIYLSGFYCQAALRVKLNDITYPQTRAKIIVSKEGQEDNLWLYEDGRFLDNKCRITRIEPISLGGGSVTLRCGSQEFTLSLGTANNMKIEISGKEQIVKLWEPISGSRIRYVAFVGEAPRSLVQNDESRAFIVGINTNKDINEAGQKIISDKIRYILDTNSRKINIKDAKQAFKDAVEKQIRDTLSGQGVTGASIIFYGDSGDIKFLGAVDSEESSESAGSTELSSNTVVDEYFNKAVSEYRKVAQLYPSEKTQQVDKVSTFGELALDSAEKLATYLGKLTTKQEILRDQQNYYPNTEMANNAKKAIAKTLSYDEKYSAKTIQIGFDYYTFQLQDVVEPSLDEASAIITVDDKEGTYTINDDLIFSEKTDGNDKEFITIKELNDEYIKVRYSVYEVVDKEKKLTGTKEQIIKLKELESLGNHQIYVSDIKLQRVANVVVEPEIIGPYTETNLSFKIGIEKRGIKLSPEKTKEMIGNLNDSIDKWQSISDKLKNVVKGWKGACYATSAFLLVKNLIDNFSGKSMARSKVMRGADGSSGWIKKCKDMVSKGDKGYVTLDQCLYGEKDSINNDVAAAQQAIEKVNKIAKDKESIKSETIFGEKILDTQKSFEGFMGEFQNLYGDKIIKINKTDGTIEDKKISELIGDYQKAYTDGIYTFSDARDWMYCADLINSGASDDTKKDCELKMSNEMKRIDSRRKDIKAVSDYKVNSDFGGGVEYIEGAGKKIYTPNIFDVETNEVSKFGNSQGQELSISEKTSFIRIRAPADLVIQGETKDQKITDYSGKVILVPLKRSENNYYPAGEAFILQSDDKGESVIGKISQSNLTKIMDRLGVSSFERIEKGKCNNPYKNPQVRFNEVEPYKGLPGIVPIDVRNGWYIATRQTIKGFGLTPYTDAGILKNFYLCNVGKDGREDFESGLRDDICTFISLETGASINHPCLTESEAKSLVNKAAEGIREAAQQYASGIKKIRIFGETFDVGVPLGGAEGTQCQDFMSPEDCYLLFNTCDPVLCPISRCNLGGAYPVRDVVQSGIIGSIALCLPNAREGIFVPVCLTGIQAGIDAYLSILKSHRDCLQESLNSGKMVGICDEIYSVYLCEFFWRQFAPLMDIFIPKMVELAYGQGTRGGGEYLTITHAWNTLDNSIKYFTDYYAQNAFQAFKVRSTEEAGTEICKSFISSRYPAGKGFFDELLEPESPVQYNAWFSEIPFTEATVPATSQYKVFYHIWAGNDEGAQYAIFLKDPPESSYYASSPRIFVDTGYIGKGGYISETKDFTAPAGYKTLCVRVNLQEECGFGQVSTSFAVDYLKEQYAKDQAVQEVTTEKECMSGTPSLYSIAQPNIEEAAQSVVQPEMYKQGIIRICSTDNPGKQTNPSRWKDVGYCGEQKLRCWLDMNSVEAVIKNNNTLTEVKKAVGDIDTEKIKEMIETKEIMSIDETKSKIDTATEMKNKINDIISSILKSNAQISIEEFAKQLENNYTDTLSELNDIEDRGFYNNQKAQAILLRAQIYDEIARTIKDFVEKQTPSSGTPTTITATATPEKTLVERATENPQGFIYKRYDSSNKKYFFYIYSEGKWFSATSSIDDVNKLSWTENKKEFYSLVFNWKTASEGLEYLKKTYSNIEYIEKK